MKHLKDETMSRWDELEEAPETKPEPAKTGDFAAEYDPAAVAAETEARLASLAEAVYRIDREMVELKENRKRAALDIEALIPESQIDPVRAEDWTITVERGERWSWDKDVLEQILKAQGIEDPKDIPDFVTKTTGIKRDKFDRQPEEVRKQYMPALTRGKGTTKITIQPDNPSLYTKET